MDNKKVKYLLKLAKQNKELRKKNEDLALNKIRFDEELSKFHKPVVEKLEEQKELREDSLKAIQDAIQNIRISPPSSPIRSSSTISEQPISPSRMERELDERLTKIRSTSTSTKIKKTPANDLDEGLNEVFLEQQDYKLPSKLINTPKEVKETLSRLQADSKLLGTYKGRWNKKIEIKKNEIEGLKESLDQDISKLEKFEITEKIKEKYIELDRLKRQLESFESDLAEFKIYRERLKSLPNIKFSGDGLISELDKLTDKLIAGRMSKKIYNEIVSILDMLLNEGSITNEQLKEYYEKYLIN